MIRIYKTKESAYSIWPDFQKGRGPFFDGFEDSIDEYLHHYIWKELPKIRKDG